MEPLLLVEDKIELRAMLRKALERNGFRVEEAPDGSAAIQKIRAKRYQMVVTDLKMPGASGLDVLRESKQADSTIPVILLTAFGSVEEAVSAMKEGAFDFIQKPVDLPIPQIVDRHRLIAVGNRVERGGIGRDRDRNRSWKGSGAGRSNQMRPRVETSGGGRGVETFSLNSRYRD